MTTEEAIKFGKRVIDLGFKDETQEFCEVAIKSLENENNVLDKVLEIIDEEYQKYHNHIAEHFFNASTITMSQNAACNVADNIRAAVKALKGETQ